MEAILYVLVVEIIMYARVCTQPDVRFVARMLE